MLPAGAVRGQGDRSGAASHTVRADREPEAGASCAQASAIPLSKTLELMATEWTVVVLGAHTCGALMARDLDATGADGDREFEFVVSCNRALVTAAAHSLVGHLTAG
jgi:DICT domain-containing protein